MLDLLFPPLCAICKNRSETKYFCPACWELCMPPDPHHRCPFCFREWEGECEVCNEAKEISFTRASIFDATLPARHLMKRRPDLIGAFAAIQFSQLDWPLPDVIIPLPSAKKGARQLADLLDLPYANILGRGGSEALEEDQTILLFDEESPLSSIREAITSLLDAYPKKGFLLSLFPCPDNDSL